MFRTQNNIEMKRQLDEWMDARRCCSKAISSVCEDHIFFRLHISLEEY